MWFGGAYLGAGFHEDGVQAGLAIAEALGGVRRPWSVPDQSARLYMPEAWGPAAYAAPPWQPAPAAPARAALA